MSEGNSIVSIIDPSVLSIPIKENDEPMIDLRNQSTILFGPSPEIPNNQDYTRMRQSVYEKLVSAQKQLPTHLRFCLYEAYRSLDLQEKLFNDRYRILENIYPEWEYEKRFQETAKLISPTINLDGSVNIPPHSTGAAIDVYLINHAGDTVDMGMDIWDWMADLDGSLSQTNSPKISDEAKKHRTIMNKVLQDVGFVNYAGEYWHWSYGDRYWAYHVGHKFALYGTYLT